MKKKKKDKNQIKNGEDENLENDEKNEDEENEIINYEDMEADEVDPKIKEAIDAILSKSRFQ